jgi:hypothetical protein
VIRPGTLLVQKGTTLPTSIVLRSEPTTDDWSAFESGAELLQLKAELSNAGWNYFYMGAVKQTVFGSPGAKRMASAMKGISAKMSLNNCNSLQIDAITPQSWLGIPYLSVTAHCCHIQKGMIFARRTQ